MARRAGDPAALQSGPAPDAARLIDETFAAARRVQAEIADIYLEAHQYQYELLRGDIGTLEALVGDRIERYPAMVISRCFLANVYLRLGRRDLAEREVTELSANDVAVLRHVTHIFAKTGAANRTEAAAYAHRHGLAQ